MTDAELVLGYLLLVAVVFLIGEVWGWWHREQ